MARIKTNDSNTKQDGVFTKKHGFISEERWRALVNQRPSWALRSVVLLFDRQTKDERAARSTRWDNDRGFNSADASRGSKLARRIMEARRAGGSYNTACGLLDASDVALAQLLAERYRRQCLNMIAAAEARS